MSIKVVQTNTLPITFWYFHKGQINYLSKKGFEIIAITSPGPLFQELKEREKIEIHGIEMTREISPVKDLVALFAILRVVFKTKPIILQGSTPKAGLLSLLAAFLLRTPVRILFMRGLRFSELQGWKRALIKFLETLTCKCAHQILCTSPSVKSLALSEKVCPPDKIKVLHHGTGNGIDTNHFNPAHFTPEQIAWKRKELGIGPDSRVLLFVGRLVKEKGVLELQEAWDLVKTAFLDIHLVVIGPVEKQDPVPAHRLEALAQDPRVHLLGFIPDVAPYYAVATMLVHPSYREGIPIAVLEASAMGLPVVATRIPGCVDAVVDGVTGLLVPPRDAPALTEAIRALLRDPELRKRMGQAGRERVLRDFRPEDIWQALYQEYLDSLEKRGIPAPLPESA